MIGLNQQVMDMRSDQLIERLRRACQKAGSQAKFAEAAGVLPQHISLVLKGKRPPGPKVLRALKLERAPAMYQAEDAA